MSLLDVLPDRCNIRRRTRSTDGLGSFTDDYDQVVADGVSCWRQAANDREVEAWAARNIEITTKIFFSTDPGVDSSCVLVFGAEIYDVQSHAVPDDSVGFGLLWRVLCKRIVPLTS